MICEQDEEFLDAIKDLPEHNKNIVIAYLKNKIEANRGKTKC